MNQELAKEVLSVPLNDAQLELLKMFASVKMTDEEMKKLRRLVAEFYLKRVTDEVDKAWDERGYTQADMDRLLHTHLRTPYRRKEG